MESKHIYELLEKYWACETSREEEHILKRFFTSEEVPGELSSYKKWFIETSLQTETLDEQFDEKMLAQLSNETTSLSTRRTFSIRRIMRVAALLLIIFTCTLFIRHYRTTQQVTSLAVMEDTYDNPEEALAAVRNALYFASEEINKGLDMTAEGFRKTKPVFEIINTN